MGFIRIAIAENDRELARNIQSILTEICSSGVVDRIQIWAALTIEEQVALSALLKETSTSLPITHYPISELTPETQTELIDPIDAEKIRDIARIWWDEYYPEHTGSLITQMFAWKSPGQKYSQEIINQ